ncbi:hypothetical protein H1R20_g15666, partial [Candolleomyces eurysporus]
MASNGRQYQPLQQLDEVEDVERYRPGGFHPVTIGDTLGGGRYRILHKLGFGGSSTVWLARDLAPTVSSKSLVSLKVMTARVSKRPPEAIAELIIPRKLRSTVSHRTALDSVCVAQHHFMETGPNGTHLCIASPLCGPSVLSTSEYLAYKYKQRIQGQIARYVAKQVAINVESMHTAGIAHGDLTTSNILFKLEEYVQGWSDTQFYDILGEPATEAVIRVDDNSPAQPGAPRELVEAIDGSRFVDASLLQGDVVLTDFGQSFSISDVPRDYSPATVVHYMPPEFRFTQKAELASDIWMLACAIFEIRAGYSLFDSFLRSSDIVLMQTVETLGRLPDPWWGQFEDRHLWFNEDGEPKPEEVQERVVHIPAAKKPLRQRIEQIWEGEEPVVGYNTSFTESRDMAMSRKEVDLLTDLLGKMLRYRPEDRIQIQEVVSHPWLDYK